MVQIKQIQRRKKCPIFNFPFSRRVNWPWRYKILSAPHRSQKIMVNQSKPILVISSKVFYFSCEIE